MMSPGAGRPGPPGYPASSSPRNETGRSRPAARTGSSRTTPQRSRPSVPALSHEPPSDPPGAPGLGPLLAEVTNAVVRLHRTHYGKGPTRSKSYLLDDVLICVMRDVFTPVERTLIEAGEPDKVRQTRLAFQDAMHHVFKDAIEGITRRSVRGFTSQVLVDQDVAIEVFVLDPGPPPAGGAVTPRAE